MMASLLALFCVVGAPPAGAPQLSLLMSAPRWRSSAAFADALCLLVRSQARSPCLLVRSQARSLAVSQLDRHANQGAVLGPRPVVVLHVRQAQDLVQDEPGVRRALADPAVRDGVLAEVDPGLVLVQGGEVAVGLEGAVLVRGLGPRNVLRGRDVAAALRLLLRQVGRGEQLAGELVGRTHVDQVALADRVDDLVTLG